MEEITMIQVNFLFSQRSNREAEQFARGKKKKNRYKIVTQETCSQKEKPAMPKPQNSLTSF